MKMKIAVLIMSIITLFSACRPDLKGELGTPSDKVAGLAGTWKVSKFSQVDLNNPIQEERDLTDFYVVEGQNPLTLSFNSGDRTYTVIPGAGRNFFGTGGTWSFDNDQAPSTLILQNEAETIELPMGAMVRVFDKELAIDVPRFCDDAAGNRTNTVIYKFRFTRQ